MITILGFQSLPSDLASGSIVGATYTIRMGVEKLRNTPHPVKILTVDGYPVAGFVRREGGRTYEKIGDEELTMLAIKAGVSN